MSRRPQTDIKMEKQIKIDHDAHELAKWLVEKGECVNIGEAINKFLRFYVGVIQSAEEALGNKKEREVKVEEILNPKK